MHDMEKERLDVCEVNLIDHNHFNERKTAMLADEVVSHLSQLYKVLGDDTRVRILWALLEQELCVCQLASLLQMSQSAISHQLRVLKQARLVRYRKEGRIVYYALDDEHVALIFQQGLAHVME